MLEVLNIKDGEVISHSLCLLRIKCSDSDFKQGTIQNCSELNGNVSSWPVKHNGFNALITLLEGENRLVISCGSQVTITIFYKPIANPKFFRFIYVTCLNEDRFQGPPEMDCSVNSAIRRIQCGALLMQTFIAETLASERLSRNTFRLELDHFSQPKVYVVQLSLTLLEAQRLSEERLWETVAYEILSSSLSDTNCKYVAFFCGTRFCNSEVSVKYEKEIVSMSSGHVSLGGGGLALVGTGAFYSWPTTTSEILNAFSNSRHVDGNVLMDFSAGRRTWGANFGTHLGSVLHEMAHTLDLGHTSYGIMARGFEDMHIFFTSTQLITNFVCQSPSHNIVMKQSFSSSLIKESVTFTTDFVHTNPLDNINMTVEPPEEPLASSLVYSPTTRCPERHVQSADVASKSAVNLDSECDCELDKCLLSSKSSRDASQSLAAPLPKYISRDISEIDCLTDKGYMMCRSFWARSSAVLLSYHKWLRPSQGGSIPELKGSVLCSASGIRVVEIRDLRNMAFHHWEFVLKPPPPVLHLPWAKISHWPSDVHIEVVAEDDSGNLMKGCYIQRPL